MTVSVREYQTELGASSFAVWFNALDPTAAARITIALSRVATGNTSNVKSLGGGISEVKIDFGPSYRVYFGWDGRDVVVLVGGGTKKRQQRDILEARSRWQDFKMRKKQGP
jgi:putative addiction module killer protein